SDLGQLHRVANLLDLIAQATDVFIADVRDLLEHQRADLGPGNHVEGPAAAAVDDHAIAGGELSIRDQGLQRSGCLDDYFLPQLVRDDQAITDDFDDRGDVAGISETGDLHDLEVFPQPYRRPWLQIHPIQQRGDS